jgi:hypothetical protein
MVEKKRSTKGLVVGMVCSWVGAAITGSMAIMKLLRHDSEFWYELAGTVFFIALGVMFTRQYRERV